MGSTGCQREGRRSGMSTGGCSTGCWSGGRRSRQGKGRGRSQSLGKCFGIGRGQCGSDRHGGGRCNGVQIWSKLPDDDPQAIARDGRQDDGCQDDPRAIALGEVGEHISMITCLWRMGKSDEF
jgi:hypothetical protein